MACLVIVGIPRTDYTLIESILQARLRAMDVFLIDRPSQLDACPEILPLANRIGVDRLDVDLVVEAVRGLNPQFVVSFGEFNLVLAAEVRERLGLQGPAADAVKLTRSKYETRRRLQKCGLTQVASQLTTLADLDKAAERFEPPFVIKPASMTGSIGVHAVRHRDEIAAFRTRFVDSEAEERRRRSFVIESFIDGDEYSVDGIYLSGQFHLFAVAQKRTSGFPNFAEVGHTLPARQRVDADLGVFIAGVAAALGLDASPIHAEVKIHGRTIELVEIHARFGGDYIPLLIERAFGYSVFGAYYDVLLGGRPRAMRPAHAVAGIQFLHAGELDSVARFPRVWPGVDYCLRLAAADAREAETDLDNIRILNHRIGHIVFSAADHDRADVFVESIYAPGDINSHHLGYAAARVPRT